MLIRLISLAFLFTVFNVEYTYSSEKTFIYPKEKPSVFKKIDRKKTSKSIILPSNKPEIKSNINKTNTKIIKEKKIKEVKKDLSVKKFPLPKKKPKS